MRLRDILSLAAHNLRESPLRTALCALSVAVALPPRIFDSILLLLRVLGLAHDASHLPARPREGPLVADVAQPRRLSEPAHRASADRARRPLAQAYA